MWGDAETRTLWAAWERAFAHLLATLKMNELERELAEHTADILRSFIGTPHVAQQLISFVLLGETPSLPQLAQAFAEQQFEATSLPFPFETLLAVLSEGLTYALQAEATQPNSPRYNRVHLVRMVAMHTLLRDQQATLATVTQQLGQLDAYVRQAGQGGKYNLFLFGPTTGFAIGDNATAKNEPPTAELRPLLAQVLAHLNAQAQPPAPYSEADKTAYLEVVIEECQTIILPYTAESGRASYPLRQIYVALKADRSSAEERKASHQMVQRWVLGQGGANFAIEENLVYNITARYAAYAGRHLAYNPQFQALLRSQLQAERTYDVAEAIRQHRWLVLLGDPGSGKNTLARWLALHLAEAVRDNRPTVQVLADHIRPNPEGGMDLLGITRLPVLVRLADYAAAHWPQGGPDTGLPLSQYLGQHLHKKVQAAQAQAPFNALIEDYRAAGRLLYLLDGLDEVTNWHQRQLLAAEMRSLHKCANKGRCSGPNWGTSPSLLCPFCWPPAKRKKT